MTFVTMWYYWHQHDMIQVASSMVHDTDVRIGASTGTKKSNNTSKQSFKYEKSNGVIDSIISIISQETCYCCEHAKN